LFTEFDLHLVDLTFVPKVHKGVQMGLRGFDESLFPIITPRLLGEVLMELQGPTTIYMVVGPVQRPKGWSDLGYFWMTGIHIVLDCLDTVVFSPLKCTPFILPAIQSNLNLID
jgi:hypothetical protein